MYKMVNDRPKGFRWKLPLQLILIAPFTLQLVVIVSLVGYFSYHSGKSAVDSLADRLLANVSQQVSDRLTMYLHSHQQAVSINHDAMTQGILNINDWETLQPYFWQQIRLSPSLTSIQFTHPDGRQLAYYRLQNQEVLKEAEKLAGEPLDLGTIVLSKSTASDPGKRDYYQVNNQGQAQRKIYTLPVNHRDLSWYRYAQTTKKQSWSPIFVYHVTPILEMFAIAPVLDENEEFAGVFSSSFSLSDIDRFLSQINFSTSGEILILERSGDLVASSSLETPLIELENQKNERLSASESQSFWTREIAKELQERFTDLKAIEETQTLSFQINNEQKFIHITPYKDEYGLDWLAIVAIPESDFAAQINANTNRTLWLCVMALGVGIGTGWLTSRAIASPIQRLTQASAILAEGAWQPSLRQDSAIAEISVLSDSFHRTAEQLQVSFDRIARELEDSEQKFATIFRTSPDPIAIISLPDGRIQEANNRQIEFLGYSHEEIVSHTTEELQIWVNSANPQQFTQILQSEGRISNLELPMRVKLGEIKTVLISAEICNLQGKDCIIVVTKDITNRKKLELSLQASEQELKRILNSVSGSIINLKVRRDRFWEINQISEGTELISGYTASELMADRQLWLSRIYPGDWEAIENRIFANIFAEKTGQYEYRIYDKINKIRWISQTNNSTWDKAQQCWMVTAISLDISDRKHLELQLQKAKEAAEVANQAKSIFLANMSHELRTPLNAILGYPQLLIESPSLSAQDREFVQVIQTSGEYLLNLINQILDLSKIEAGHISLNPSYLKLTSLLRDLETMFENKAQGKGLELQISCGSNIPHIIHTDGVKLQQILVNLLNNAIKFTESGSVSLNVNNLDVDGDRLQFTVTDTGVGIAPKELECLFQPFIQTKSGRESQEGTGLGLAISQKFVQLLGGTLRVESTLGQGTMFQFDMEVAQESSLCRLPQSLMGKAIALATGQPTYRILVVDDNQVNRQLLVMMLQIWGFEVVEAEDGEEAIAQWKLWQPDLIFMDIRMPKLNGDRAVEKIRQQAPDSSVAIVAVTASIFEEDENRMLNLGCNDFIRKPFKKDEIITCLETHLKAEFVYTDGIDSTDTPPLKGLTVENLRSLSQQWRTQFYQAMVDVNYNQMFQLLDRLEAQYANLAQDLREEVDAFEFDRLFTLFDRV